MSDPAAGRQITLDELPRFSGWPKRLLALEPFEIRNKTAAEVMREFETDKWGKLALAARSMKNPTLLEIERASVELDGEVACFDNGGFYLRTMGDLLARQADLYVSVLGPAAEGASCLVELGAGFGSMLYRVARRPALARLPVYAGEYTASGRELLTLLAGSIEQRVVVGHCDFRTMSIAGMEIPENALIFTSFAAHYVPQLSTEFVSFLTRLKPRAVVHFEPCYEHYSAETLHGLMCRRYVELNDYTRNLVTVIESARAQGAVVRTRKNVFGSNPFLPLSVIEWAPR